MIELNQQDLDKINNMILDMPFRYGYPLFQLLKTKLNEKQSTEISKINGPVNTPKNPVNAPEPPY